MANYRGFVTLSEYRCFEFEADDDQLAWDHLETLIDNVGFERIRNEWEESGPAVVLGDDVVEI